MGANTAVHNGTTIAQLCYEDKGGYRNIGSLIYFRTHEAEIKLDIIPFKAWEGGVAFFIGNFIKSEKVPEPPFIDGDIMATTDERGKPIQVGHIHTRDDATGTTQYFFTLFGIPVGAWRNIIMHSEDGKGRRALYMKIKMEDK